MAYILDPQMMKELMTVDDVQMILDVLGIKYRRNGIKSLVAKCPNPAHIDKKPSWDINIQKQNKRFCIHSCFSCGFSGDIIGLVETCMGLKNRFQALKFISNLLNKTLTEEFLYERNLMDKKKFFEIRKIKKLKFKMPEEWELVNEDDEYWDYLTGDKRQLTPEIIERAKLGKCETGYYRKRVVAPIYFNKEVVFFFARNNDDIRTVAKDARGWYPKFSKSSYYVYPYDWLDFDLDYVILVEGVFDCLRLWSMGYKNVVCLFGNKISEIQAQLLFPFKTIILVPDADGELDLEGGASTKGMLMVQYAHERLIHEHQVKVVWIPEGNDPGDVPEKDLKKAFQKMTSIFKKPKGHTVVDYSISKK